MAFNQGCRGLVASVPGDMRYFRYQLYGLRDELVARGAGSTFMELSTDALAAVPVMQPPLDEQCRIADFLDAETARIDELVSLRNLQVGKIFQALDSEARRDTGPEWRRVALRRVVDTVQTGTTPTGFLQSSANSYNMPWYTPAALGGTLDLNEADRSVRREDVRQVPRFPSGSILIVGIGESLGKVADLDHEATGNQQLTAIKTSSSVDRRFVAWQLFAAYEEIRTWAQYSRIRILNNDVLKSFVISIPPIGRQIEVRRDLDRRLGYFREFRDAAARFSSLAAERRQALITAAISGQIDVTTARGGDV
jgi:type I restriction enzyme S subunit